jgi:hypothetical protein
MKRGNSGNFVDEETKGEEGWKNVKVNIWWIQKRRKGKLQGTSSTSINVWSWSFWNNLTPFLSFLGFKAFEFLNIGSFWFWLVLKTLKILSFGRFQTIEVRDQRFW